MNQHESIGMAIQEIIRWNPITWRRDVRLDELQWESFRNRLKDSPILESIPGTFSYMRNVYQDGIRLKNTLEQIIRHEKESDLPEQTVFEEMGLSDGWTDRDLMWPAIGPLTRVDLVNENRSAAIYQSSWRGNSVLSHRKMDDRDFKQRCVQHYGKNYVLYPGAYADTGGPNHLKKDTWIKWLESPCRCNKECQHLSTGIDALDADTIATVFAKLKMDRTRTIKSVFGYAIKSNDKDEIWRDGIKSLDREELKDFAFDLEMIEYQLPKLPKKGQPDPVRTLNDEREFYLDLSYRLLGAGQMIDLENPLQQMAYIETMAKVAMESQPEPSQHDIATIIEYGFDEIDSDDTESEDQDYESIEYKSNGDGWTAFPLSDGQDAIDYTWVAYIKTATIRKLQSWKKVAIRYGHSQYRARLSFQQKSDLWSRIWERQEKLATQIEPLAIMDKTIREIVHEMQYLSFKQAGALIYQYSIGGAFSAYTEFDFSNEPNGIGNREFTFWLWDKRKKMFNV